MTTSTPTRAAPRVVEIAPDQLAERAPRARRIDVREACELDGELGRALGAEHVPLAALAALSAGWSRDRPLVLICRSGRRSAQAADYLVKAGFAHVYNLAGGMVAYKAAGLAMEPGR